MHITLFVETQEGLLPHPWGQGPWVEWELTADVDSQNDEVYWRSARRVGEREIVAIDQFLQIAPEYSFAELDSAALERARDRSLEQPADSGLGFRPTPAVR